MTNFVTLLKEKGLTVTPQRVEIINILSTNRHINVDELYQLLNTTFPSISLATVYKNINIMLGKLLLSEVQIPNRKNVYEIIKEEHSHITCVKCEEILDLDLDISKLFQSAEKTTGYNLNTSSVVFTGICPQCN